MPDGFCPRVWASGLSGPRSIVTVSDHQMLVLERSQQQVVGLFDDANFGTPTRVVLGNAQGINHGLEVNNGYLYASSPSTVYRWKFTAGSRERLGAAQVVVSGVPTGGHSTRTMRFKDGRLYLQCGSYSNVDADYSHSMVRAFNIPDNLPRSINWNDGEIMYYGMRNEVGLRFDTKGRLWGVENGVDNLFRSDLGGNIKEDNPAEEVNIFEEKGYYGYPYCWSEGKLSSGKGAKTQWVHNDFMGVGNYSDAWCEKNAIKPSWALQAHTAPLDILFFPQSNSFPEKYRGSAFVTEHGSWNRVIPSGYRVVFLKLDSNLNPVSEEPFLYHSGSSAPWPNGIRPVGLAVKKCAKGDCLYVSSDASGSVIEISYQG